MKNSGVATLMMVVPLIVGLLLGYGVGYDNGVLDTRPVACEPNVDGLKVRGKEVPLTSAQRDSLARMP